jgi:hypothetical protein
MTVTSAGFLAAGNISLSLHMPLVPHWKLRAGCVALLWFPLTGTAMLFCQVFFGGLFSVERFITLLPPMAAVLPALQLVLSSTRIACPDETNQSSTPPNQGEKLLARLPLPLCDGRLLAVEAHDHYVRVHTDRGSTLLRMRFSDSLALLDETPGTQVHRSWWLKRDSVQRVRKRKKGAIVTLTNGQEVPATHAAAKVLLASTG